MILRSSNLLLGLSTIFLLVLPSSIANTFNTSYEKTVNLTSTATLHWTVNVPNDTIRLALHVKDPIQVTAGHAWLGIGIGEPTSGSMIGADIATVSFMPNATSNCTITDRHVPFVAFPLQKSTNTSASVYPLKDACPESHWHLYSCFRDISTGVLSFELERTLTVVDTQDRPILPGPSVVLHAYGTSFGYHGPRRHSSVVRLYEDPNLLPPRISLPDDATTSVELRATNYTVPADDGIIYTVTSMRVSKPGERKTVVAVEPVFDNPPNDMVHHFTVYSCSSEKYAAATARTVLQEGQIRGPAGNPACSVLVYGWAKGTGRLVFPREAGLSFTDKRPFIVMETHFDNPKKITGRVDRSGIRLHFSDKPRQFEMGTLQLGDSFVSRIGQIVRSDKPYVHTCPSECTRGFSQNITVFDSFLHMHRTGEETYINLFSENGTFLQTLHQVNFWNDGFQKSKEIRPTVTIQPGDQLSMSCKYDTSKLPLTRFGGKTENEMCAGFLFYYPAQVDTRTNHELNMCSFLQRNKTTDAGVTLCGENSRIEEMLQKNFSLGVIKNLIFNDTVGAPTNFSDDSGCPAESNPAPAITMIPNSNETTEETPSPLEAPSVEPEKEILESVNPEPTFNPKSPAPTQTPGQPTQTPTQTTAPNSTSDDPACFPASATTRTRDGRSVAMKDLRVGDEVAVGDEEFSRVFGFSHADRFKNYQFVRLHCGEKISLTLSSGHYVPIGNGRREMRTARDVKIGDKVMLENAELAVVTKIEIIWDTGLYNPQTMQGYIVVDGVVVSTFTEAVQVETAVALLAPLRWAFSFLGLDGSSIMTWT